MKKSSSLSLNQAPLASKNSKPSPIQHGLQPFRRTYLNDHCCWGRKWQEAWLQISPYCLRTPHQRQHENLIAFPACRQPSNCWRKNHQKHRERSIARSWWRRRGVARIEQNWLIIGENWRKIIRRWNSLSFLRLGKKKRGRRRGRRIWRFCRGSCEKEEIRQGEVGGLGNWDSKAWEVAFDK